MMTKQLSWCLSTLAGLLAVCAGGTVAHAKDCSGTLTPGSYDNVNVPAGQFCTISGTVDVTGNVTVGAGAILQVLPTAKFTVNSSLLATNAASVNITSSAAGAVNILGSVSVTGTGFVLIEETFIGGTVSVANSHATFIILFQDNVGGNVLVRNNNTSGGPNSNTIAANIIGGSLVCSGNTPAPGLGGGGANTVGGARAGQCSGL
jgi:hypothetical protein